MKKAEVLLSVVPKTADQAINWPFIEESLWPVYVSQMKATQQNPLYHGEGDVWTHTKMVCEGLAADSGFWACGERQRQELFLAALLHDIGKIVTTTWQDGAWTSPNHALRGANMVRELLWREYGLCGTEERRQFRETVCLLVRYHMTAPYIMEKDKAEQRLMRMAANGALTADFTLKHLFLLSKADANGKISEGNPKSEASVLLAGELAQEISCYEKPFTFASPYAEYAYLSGKTTDPHNHLYNNTQTTAVMLCGLPGTGKDTYCQQCFPDWPMVSLDAIREETGIPPVGSQKEVVQIARSRAKAFLRQRQSFVWNATSITPDIRSHFVKLCEDYHAYVRIVFLETAYDENLKRNQNRRKAVPPSVIDKMLSKLVLPERFEAHEIMWHCV